ncbi:MAG: S9 family peptidase, partial [Planctomycetes bacterium]|nr:S9 family peptidase [Planctomycetota bacterium]
MTTVCPAQPGTPAATLARVIDRAQPVCLLLAIAVLPAQDSARLDAIRITSGEFASQRFGPERWLDGAHYATLEPKAGGGPLELVRYEAVSGAREVLVSAAMLWVAAAGAPLAVEDWQFSPDGRQLLVFTHSERVWRQNTRGEYWVLPLDGKQEPRRLGGKLPVSSLQFAKWSPDGTRVAYVSGNDLWVEHVATKAQTRLTTDGSRTVINGTFDWVYEEEFDCRDGFRWSPDGRSIAYWQLDCSGVGEFLMIDNLSDRYSKVVPVQYPKAGTTNSACKVGVVAATGGKTVWMQTPGEPRETYLPRMEWHPKGAELMVQWLPRAQNVLQVLCCDVKTGAARLVHEEMDEAYVDVAADFHWRDAEGADFLWTRESAVGRNDGLARRCPGYTSWERPSDSWHPLRTNVGDVIAVAHWDENADRCFLLHSDGNATQQYLFAVSDRDSRVTPGNQPGWHDYQISQSGSFAIHTFSSFDVPPVIDLVKLPSHERVRVLVDNAPLRERYAAVQK